MQKIFLKAVLVLSVCVVCASTLWAGEVDILVDKLVEKGILSPVEAQIILDETKQQVAKEISEGKSAALPKWVQNIKLKGDARLRYQFEKKHSTEARNRGRVRYRLGVESKLGKDLKVGAGLASGGDDPRSTNQTFGDTFSTKDIRLDLAYAEYTPWDNLAVVAGKFKRKPYLWQASDMIWDGDINPEGGSLAFNYPLSSLDADLFFNSGVWILDESSSDTSDPIVTYVQPGFTAKLTDNISLKSALAYYHFNSIKKAELDHSAGTNAIDSNGGLTFGYDSFNPNLELAFKDPFGGLVKYASLFGGYVHNLDSAANDDSGETDGWQAGVKFGDKKVKKPGQWQVKYQYTRLEKEAFPDAFPDSDRISGKTDVKGHEAIINYGLRKNVILGLDYYYSDRIKAAEDRQHIVQADVLFKF